MTAEKPVQKNTCTTLNTIKRGTREYEKSVNGREDARKWRGREKNTEIVKRVDRREDRKEGAGEGKGEGMG